MTTTGKSFADHSIALLPIIRAQLPTPCEVAVDLGCGIGLVTEKLADFIPVLVGIDSDPCCIAVARAKGDRTPALTFRVGRAEKLDACIRPTQLDLIFSTFALHHSENLTTVLQGLDRYLRPGGRLIVVDLFGDPAKGFYRSLLNQLILAPFQYLPAFRRTATDFGVLTPLRLLCWRLMYAASTAGRAHMRSDFQRNLPPSLSAWRHAWNSALPSFSERVLIGGIALFTWTKDSM